MCAKGRDIEPCSNDVRIYDWLTDTHRLPALWILNGTARIIVNKNCERATGDYLLRWIRA